jgi:large subunit ribosomal protein L18
MKRKIHNEKSRRWRARRARTRKSVARSEHPRLVVFRSSRHIYAQIVDPDDGHTITSVSTRQKAVVGDGYTGNVEAAKKVGAALGEIAKQKQIGRVVFNRNGFLFHGRVKALAEAAKEAGLEL